MEQKIRKGNNWQRGLLAALAVAFAIIAVIIWMWGSVPSVDTLRAEQHIYPQQKDGISAVPIQAISSPLTTTEDNKEALYLVQVAGRYMGLRAPVGDKEIEQLLTQTEAEQYIVANVQIPQDELLPLTQVFRDINGDPSLLETSRVLSVTKVRSAAQSSLIGVLVVSGLAIAFGAAAWYQDRRNKRYAAELYEAYPELRDQLSLLDSNARFYSDALKLCVYKDHLIGSVGGLTVIPLHQVDWLYHLITAHRRYGITVSKTYQIIAMFVSAPKRSLQLPRGKQEHIEAHLSELYQFVAENYPQVLLGFNQKETFNQLKQNQRP